jgi:hypothetical protein
VIKASSSMSIITTSEIKKDSYRTLAGKPAKGASGTCSGCQ